MWTFPLVLHLGDSLLAPPDTLHSAWVIAWDVHALVHDPLHLYEANIYYPFPLSLTYSDAMISGAVLIAPLYLLTNNPALALNVLTLASLALAGFGMFLLVRTLTCNYAAGLLAGFVFAFCASRQSHLEHANLLQMGWLPLGLVCLHNIFKGGRLRDFVLLAICSICQALASLYLAWMMAIVYVVFIIVQVFAARTLMHWRRMAGAVLALMLAGGIALGVSFPYAISQRLYDFQWPADVVDGLSAAPSDFLSAPPQNLLFGQALAAFANPSYTNEHWLFPGLCASALAAFALFTMTRRLEVIRYFLIGLVALALSFGTHFQMYVWLLNGLPGFAVMRAPARFDFVVMLSLAVLVGFGFARLATALAHRSERVRHLVLIGVSLLTIAELVPAPQPLAAVPTSTSAPPVYTWLRDHDPASVVTEMPARATGRLTGLKYEYLSTFHWHPLVNGGSAFDPPAADQIADQVDDFPDPVAIECLRSLGVQYVVVHQDAITASQKARLASSDLSGLPVTQIINFGTDTLYQLAPLADAPRPEDHLRIDLPSLIGRGQPPSVFVSLSNDTGEPMFIGAPQAFWLTIASENAQQILRERHELPAFLLPDQELDFEFPLDSDSLWPTADSGRLDVQITGTIQSRLSQTVGIADLPTSTQSGGLAANVERVVAPSHAPPDAPIDVALTVRNTGSTVWLQDSPPDSGRPGAVGLSLKRWLAPNGAVLPPTGFHTTHLRSSVNPGQAVSLTLQVISPHDPGDYTMVFDLLSENVTWFSDLQTNQEIRIPIRID